MNQTYPEIPCVMKRFVWDDTCPGVVTSNRTFFARLYEKSTPFVLYVSLLRKKGS